MIAYRGSIGIVAVRGKVWVVLGVWLVFALENGLGRVVCPPSLGLVFGALLGFLSLLHLTLKLLAVLSVALDSGDWVPSRVRICVPPAVVILGEVAAILGGRHRGSWILDANYYVSFQQ